MKRYVSICAIIQYRLYPYLLEGFEPLLEVVDKKGDIVGNIDIVGIQDIGRFYEATFDISNNEVLALEDKWDMTLDPKKAKWEIPDASGNYPYTWGFMVYDDNKGIEKYVRGIVPGDIYGIYSGITDAFENRTLSLDAEGNFSMNHKGLEMTGNINIRTGMGTGKFKLKATSSGDDFVTEAEAFDGWYAYSLWGHAGKPSDQIPQGAWTDLKHFDADFTVEGTLSIQYSELMQQYVIHLDGIGNFNFNGVVYTSGNDTYWELNEDGMLVMKYHSKSMELRNVFVKDGSFLFSPTLIFE